MDQAFPQLLTAFVPFVETSEPEADYRGDPFPLRNQYPWIHVDAHLHPLRKASCGHEVADTSIPVPQ